MSKWGLLVAGGLLLVAYNAAQSDVMEMRAMPFATNRCQKEKRASSNANNTGRRCNGWIAFWRRLRR